MIGFIILHYVAINETINCINSIKKNIKHKKKIVVVDNCSPNNSGELLKEKYSQDKDVIILINEKNEGFAKGNNIGYKYIKTNYNCNYIVCMNNDIEINDQCFFEKINNIYNKYKFDVLGPDVFCTTLQIHQSPKRLKSYTYDDIVKEYKKYQSRCKNKLIVKFKIFFKKIPLLKRITYLFRIKKNNINYKKEYSNVPLHGSCVIFSKDFVKKRNYAFYDKTFMYFEMEILDYECKRDNLKELYCPDIKVLHHHNVSTNLTYSTEFEKIVFMNENIKKSLEEFLILMKKDKKRNLYED